MQARQPKSMLCLGRHQTPLPTQPPAHCHACRCASTHLFLMPSPTSTTHLLHHCCSPLPPLFFLIGKARMWAEKKVYKGARSDWAWEMLMSSLPCPSTHFLVKQEEGLDTQEAAAGPGKKEGSIQPGGGGCQETCRQGSSSGIILLQMQHPSTVLSPSLAVLGVGEASHWCTKCLLAHHQ